jgi:hypothetical protein
LVLTRTNTSPSSSSLAPPSRGSTLVTSILNQRTFSPTHQMATACTPCPRRCTTPTRHAHPSTSLRRARQSLRPTSSLGSKLSMRRQQDRHRLRLRLERRTRRQQGRHRVLCGRRAQGTPIPSETKNVLDSLS